VFVAEQQLYTKKELDAHNAEGDKTGSLAGTSFRVRGADVFA
jgi:hypothetical protein